MIPHHTRGCGRAPGRSSVALAAAVGPLLLAECPQLRAMGYDWEWLCWKDMGRMSCCLLPRSLRAREEVWWEGEHPGQSLAAEYGSYVCLSRS